jgi:Fe-S-cluster-containing hydrogenase component 2
MKAIEMIDEKPIWKIEKCIGCGLCATGCPNSARRMERSADITEPPTNFMELGGRILQDQGKLEAFMEFNSSVVKPAKYLPPDFNKAEFGRRSAGRETVYSFMDEIS